MRIIGILDESTILDEIIPSGVPVRVGDMVVVNDVIHTVVQADYDVGSDEWTATLTL